MPNRRLVSTCLCQVQQFLTRQGTRVETTRQVVNNLSGGSSSARRSYSDASRLTSLPANSLLWGNAKTVQQSLSRRPRSYLRCSILHAAQACIRGGFRMICQQTVVLLIAALSEEINHSLLESWRQCLQAAAHGSPLLAQTIGLGPPDSCSSVVQTSHSKDPSILAIFTSYGITRLEPRQKDP